jgi:hypothetical protein
MAEVNGLRDIYIDQLRDLYDAEHRLIKALPKMAKAADSEDLRSGEHPSSDGGKANDSICSASRVTRKDPRSISRSRVAEPLLPRTPSGSLPRPPI